MDVYLIISNYSVVTAPDNTNEINLQVMVFCLFFSLKNDKQRFEIILVSVT